MRDKLPFTTFARKSFIFIAYDNSQRLVYFANNRNDKGTNSHKKRILHISLLRIAFFLAGIAGIILFFHAGTWALIGTVCCTFLPFLILIKLHNRFFARKEWLETQAQINREELKGLDGDFSDFDEGKEFANPEHPYSFDLDLFGRRSLFQAMNRTCTHIGKQTLARWMQEHLTKRKE